MKNRTLINQRKKLGLTQHDVAKKVGVSQTAYYFWESGIRNPCSKNIIKLCKILKLLPSDFFNECEC